MFDTSKRYRDPIELKLADRRPRAFVWRGRNYEINEVLKRWTVSGDWWQKESRRLHAVVAAKHYTEIELDSGHDLTPNLLVHIKY